MLILLSYLVYYAHMKITKLGHCCLLIETKGVRILTDPGSYSVLEHSMLSAIDFCLFTHEHQDHYHLESLRELMIKNPDLVIICNDSVSSLLLAENIDHIKISHLETKQIRNVSLLVFGETHAQMHSSIPLSLNTGFLIDNRLWYPGDAFTDPQRPVEILALPVSGPWMKIGDAIDYALHLKPKVAFPVHDGTRFGSAHTLPKLLLEKDGIEFRIMTEGSVEEF